MILTGARSGSERVHLLHPERKFRDRLLGRFKLISQGPGWQMPVHITTADDFAKPEGAGLTSRFRSSEAAVGTEDHAGGSDLHAVNVMMRALP